MIACYVVIDTNGGGGLAAELHLTIATPWTV